MISCRCVISYTENQASEDFYSLGADAKLPDLAKVTLSAIFDPLRSGEPDILVDVRDLKTVSATVAETVIPGSSKQVPGNPVEEKKAAEPFYKGWTPHMMTLENWGRSA